MTVALGLALALLGAADPRVQLGIDAYSRGAYVEARDALAPLADSPALPDADRRTARIYLAAAYLELKDTASAQAQLLTLYRQFPEAVVDASEFAPRLVALAAEAREAAAREREAIAPPAPPSTRPVPDAPVVAAPLPEPRAGAPGWARVVPFGVGQFARGDTGRGAVFLASEVALFGTWAAGAAALQGMKVDEPGTSYWSGNGRYADPATANAINLVQYGAFYAGVAVAALGIAEALIHDP